MRRSKEEESVSVRTRSGNGEKRKAGMWITKGVRERVSVEMRANEEVNVRYNEQ